VGEDGVLVHSAASQPFQGGGLCTAAPVRRTPAVSSGGTGTGYSDCSGVYRIDFNTFVAGDLGGHPAPALRTPGTQVHAQWWGRNPGFAPPNQTTLSGGLAFTMCY
jgi:hypothetical protein